MVDREESSGDSDVESIKTDQNTTSHESNYSDDTFESITNESVASQPYESESFESYISAEETDSLLASIPLQHPTKDGHSSSIERQRIRKWIGALHEKTTDERQCKEVIEPLSGASEDAADEALDALQSFCFCKIRQIRHSSPSLKQDCGEKEKTTFGAKSRKADTGDVNSAAPSALVNRIHLNNFRATLKQAKEMKIHDPSKCPDCLRKKADLAKMDFIRRRKTAVEAVLLEEKLEEQLYLKDSITLIGEIHRTLPRLSEDPQLVWQRLLESRPTRQSLVAGVQHHPPAVFAKPF